MKLVQFINRYASTIGIYSTNPELIDLERNARGRRSRMDSVAQIRDLEDATTMTYFFPKTDITPATVGVHVDSEATEYTLIMLRRFLSVHNKVGIKVALLLNDVEVTLGYVNCTEEQFEAEQDQQVMSNYVSKRNVADEKIYVSDTAIVNKDELVPLYIALTVTPGFSPTPNTFTLQVISDTTGFTPVTLVGVGMWPLVSVTTATLDPAVIAQLDELQNEIEPLSEAIENIDQEYTKR